jgi:hypothetical protein
VANIVIDIASEFTGAKAFKKADSATQQLTRNVKKLAATVGLAYSGTQILAFAKSSVKAAAADQKAQQQLALALKNVGLGRDAATSEAYIQRLQSEFGIVDDLLRPAYQTLAVATGNTAEAQRLLNLSLDISASTGRDLTSVTAALSRAFLGNNTALSKLGIGISKADLKAKSFDDITKQLTTTFAGSATAAANTFQGSMDKLGVASANVSEIIGTSLIDALKGLGDENSVDNLAKSMERAAERTGDVIRGIGVLITKLKQIPGMPDFGVLFDISYLRLLEKIGASSRAGVGGGFPQGAPSDLTRQFPISKSKPDKTAKETLKINKESLKLSKAKAVFDLQKIQIQAALKGKISEEDKIRLKLMKAIIDENMTDVEKYQQALEKAQTKTKELTDLLTAVKTLELADPFGAWSVDPLTVAINALTTSIGGVGTAITATGKEYATFTAGVAATVLRPNLTEWSSSFSKATGEVTTALTTATNGITKTATDATASILTTSKAADSILGQLYIDGEIALTDAANATTTDFSILATDTLQSVKYELAAVTAELAAAIAAAAAQAAADAADLAGAGTAGYNNAVTVIVEGSVIAQNDLATIVNDAINNSSAAGNAVGFNRTATTMAIE